MPAAALPHSTTSPPGLTVVLGAGGGLGMALVGVLCQQGRPVLGLGRGSQPTLDYLLPDSIALAAAHVKHYCTTQNVVLRQLIVATGYLHGPAPLAPERSWAQIDPVYLQQVFAINTLGPALVIKHFFPLLPRYGSCAAAFLSAKVGSVGDNALGGWYGYRAAKAALNQLVKTASIELTRHNRTSLCVALHPGTLDTALSRPFAKTGLRVRPPDVAARNLIDVLQALQPADTGGFYDYAGQRLPW